MWFLLVTYLLVHVNSYQVGRTKLDKHDLGSIKGTEINVDKLDYFDNTIKDEFYNGITNNINSKNRFENGNYRDIKATGHNKQNTFDGDYVTNNQLHDVNKKETLYSDLSNNVNNKINSDKYFGKYFGGESKKYNDNYVRYGEYNDKEFNKNDDFSKYFKKYNGRDKSEKQKHDVKHELRKNSLFDRYNNIGEIKDNRNNIKYYGDGFGGERSDKNVKRNKLYIKNRLANKNRYIQE